MEDLSMKKIICTGLSLSLLISSHILCAQAASDELFSSRDLDASYEESESVFISLEGDNVSSSSDAVEISGSTVTITDEGTYILSGNLKDGMIIVDAEDSDKVQLVLDGVSVNSKTSAALYVLQADKVFVTLANGSENTLSNGGTFEAIDDNNIDAAVFSKDDLTLNGSGSLTVSSPAGHGIISKDNLVLTGGTYNITSGRHGLSGKDSVRIANGNYEITSGKDSIHAENTDDTSLGYLCIAGGAFAISSEDDGLSASGNLTVSGGSLEIEATDDGLHSEALTSITDGEIVISKSYEGIEGLCVEISGGNISVTSEDDGLNAAGGNDESGFGGSEGARDFGGMKNMEASSECYINISGGNIEINASGDGIDSNGSLTVSGGCTLVSGPVNDGNGALDYGLEADITGGIFAACGSSGMAQNFSSASQGCIMISVDTQSGGKAVTLADNELNEIFSWTPQKEYSSVLISCPEMKENETYILTAGNASETITLDNLLHGSGQGFGGRSSKMGTPGGQRPDRQDFDTQMPERPDGQIPEGKFPDEQDFDGQMPNI